MVRLHRISLITLLFMVVFLGFAQAQTINLLMEGVPDTFIVKDLLPEFEKETGIKVQFEVVN